MHRYQVVCYKLVANKVGEFETMTEAAAFIHEQDTSQGALYFAGLTEAGMAELHGPAQDLPKSDFICTVPKEFKP